MQTANQNGRDRVTPIPAPPNVKVYVHVIVDFDKEGKMRPTHLEWEDGRMYEIDAVTDVRPSYAARGGGQGDRYTVRINNRISSLYFEHNAEYGKVNLGKWFVERK